MKWLFWREYRLNRLILIIFTLLLFLPYVIALIALSWPSEHVVRPPDASEAFGGAALYSLVLTQLVVALLGGNAMAGERADRSAHFMAYLPVSRARRVGCKLTLALSVVTLIWRLRCREILRLHRNHRFGVLWRGLAHFVISIEPNFCRSRRIYYAATSPHGSLCGDVVDGLRAQ